MCSTIYYIFIVRIYHLFSQFVTTLTVRSWLGRNPLLIPSQTFKVRGLSLETNFGPHPHRTGGLKKKWLLLKRPKGEVKRSASKRRGKRSAYSLKKAEEVQKMKQRRRTSALEGTRKKN